MSRIALLGMAPLPFEKASRHHAPGIRSWQLARPLLRAGHRVRLLLCRYPEAYDEAFPDRASIPCPEGGGSIGLYSPEAFSSARLDAALAEEPFDVLVGASARPSARAAQLAGDRPLWADLFGHTLAEGQCKAVLHDRDDLLIDYYQVEARVLSRADAISVVSRPQELAVIGELGLAGRLNRMTERHRFTHVIPCAAADPEPRPAAPQVRGACVPDDAFIALSGGGYNTWADVPTLMNGLERAMDAVPSLHFVSTGGDLVGQDPETYESMKVKVAQSRHRDRFHLLGWVAREAVTASLYEADIGLCVDRDLWEGRFGSRNRIPTYLAHGLTVVSARVSEVSAWAEEAGLSLTFPAGDAEALAVLLTDLARRPEVVRARREQVARRAQAELSFERTAEPLVAFADAPARSPDHEQPNLLAQKLAGEAAALDRKDVEIRDLAIRLRNAEIHVKNLDSLIAEKDRAIEELRGFERRVKGSMPYRLYRLLRGG